MRSQTGEFLTSRRAVHATVLIRKRAANFDADKNRNAAHGRVDERWLWRAIARTLGAVVAARTDHIRAADTKRSSGHDYAHIAQCRNHSGNVGTITGAQFESGAIVKIANATVFSVVSDSTTIRFSNSGAHAPGQVDVVVTNPGGRAATLANGYRYTAPDSFDANGEWIAHADGSNHFLTDMRFIIQNNALISLSCGSEATPVTTPITLTVENGSFSFSGIEGLSISGKLDSMITSHGQASAPGCGDGIWWADKLIH
jgi:hypothetical protein